VRRDCKIAQDFAPSIPFSLMSVVNSVVNSYARCWCFTWNNYTPEVVARVERFRDEHCLFMIYGYEIGLEHTPHL